ncbi:MAG: hypothetical protein N2204_07245, partial [Anaerolineae bacterium]|nr:hypothetical protein [Anaerolineae bacterium]
MTATTVKETAIIPRRFMTRARWFGLIYLVIAAVLLYLATTAVAPEALSRFRLGRINPDILQRLPEAWQPALLQGIPVPSRAALQLLGILFLLLGIPPFFLSEEQAKRHENGILGLAFAGLLAAALIGAAAGKRTDLVGMLADGIRLATPIALGSLAGIMCERSGVVNIGIEGMM